MNTASVYAAAVYGRQGIGRCNEPRRRTQLPPELLPRWDELFRNPYERYPRLDPLSKVVAILAELVCENTFSRNQLVGVALGTEYGCVEADWDYYQTAAGPTPELASPKLFPYTLPSAGLAEVCIRWNFQGPALVSWGTTDMDPLLAQVFRWLARDEIELGLVAVADALLESGADLYQQPRQVQGFALLLGKEPRPVGLERKSRGWAKLSWPELARALEHQQKLEHAHWRMLSQEA